MNWRENWRSLGRLGREFMQTQHSCKKFSETNLNNKQINKQKTPPGNWVLHFSFICSVLWMMSPGVVAPNNSWSASHRRTLSAAAPVFFRLMAIITTGNQRHLKLLTAAVLHENRAHLFCFLVCPQQLQQHLECKRRLYLNTRERVRLPSSFRNFFSQKEESNGAWEESRNQYTGVLWAWGENCKVKASLGNSFISGPAWAIWLHDRSKAWNKHKKT